MLTSLLNRIKSAAPENTHAVEEAACALLFEVAWADQSMSPEEAELVRHTVKEVFELPDATIDEILTTGQENQNNSVGVQSFTRVLTENWEEKARFDLVVALWRIAFNDSDIHKYEEHTIRHIADLLYVSHTRFIQAKRAAKQLTNPTDKR